jgi:signal peptidase II
VFHLYFYIIAAFIIGLDQLSKWLIATTLRLNERVTVIGEFFELTSHRNRGAAFGILQGQRWLFLLITIVVVIGLIWYIYRTWRKGLILAPLAYCMILGGAVGNFIDRALYGEVIDFFKFRFQFQWFGTEVDYTYPIFNVADMAIVGGVILAMIQVWRERDDGSQGNERT